MGFGSGRMRVGVHWIGLGREWVSGLPLLSGLPVQENKRWNGLSTWASRLLKSERG